MHNETLVSISKRRLQIDEIARSISHQQSSHTVQQAYYFFISVGINTRRELTVIHVVVIFVDDDVVLAVDVVVVVDAVVVDVVVVV